MSKTAIIIKREFLEFVQTRTFLIMTLLGPLLIAGFIAIEFFILTRGGGGAYTISVIDDSPDLVGQKVEVALRNAKGFMGKAVSFRITRFDQPANVLALRDSLDKQITAKSAGGYLVIPKGVLGGETVHYYGKDATNSDLTRTLAHVVETVVQSARLGREGIDPTKVAAALQPVPFEAEKTSGGGLRGSAGAAQVMATLMGFAIYLVIALYGQAIMNGVLEEKRDKIVEVIVSSVPAPKIVIGKVLGIGGAGLVQMMVWVISVGLAITYAGSIAALLHVSPEKAREIAGLVAALPRVPLSVGIVFLMFFVGGFLIYSSIYASIGAIVTTTQEAQQLIFPALMPLIIGFLMANTAMRNADAQTAIVGSFIPFTAPLVMPVRAVLGSASTLDIAISFALVIGTAFLMLWLSGKIYRVGIFATGKRPTMKEVARWVRAS